MKYRRRGQECEVGGEDREWRRVCGILTDCKWCKEE